MSTAEATWRLPRTGASAGRALEARVEDAFAAEERAGHLLAVRGRTIALLAVALLLTYLVPFPGVVYYYGLIALFLLIGLANLELLRVGRWRPWHAYAFAALDSALLAFTLLYPNPLAAEPYPPQLSLHLGNFIYFFVLLAGFAFSYRPLLVVWAGLAGALAWTAGVVWLVLQPGTIDRVPEWTSPALEAGLVTGPTYVDLGVRVQEIIVFLVVAALLATAVRRSRRLVRRQVRLERERSSLARYFPPATVDLLSRKTAPLSEIREQQVAVLFADIVGFTRWAETQSPQAVIALLREVHALLESAVFANAGTLDKFIGDGMMATFGTPEASPRDASNAMRCAVDIVAAMAAWNAARERQAAPVLPISLGLHYGPAVVGDIGTERRLEYAVLGDTVNVASRLEQATRAIGCRALISEAVIDAISLRPDDAGDGHADLTRHGPITLRGRERPITAWKL